MKIKNSLIKRCLRDIKSSNPTAKFSNPLKINNNTYSFDIAFLGSRRTHLQVEFVFNLFSISDDDIASFYVDVDYPLEHMSGHYSAPIYELAGHTLASINKAA